MIEDWKLVHIGLVTSDVEKAISVYRALGATEAGPAAAGAGSGSRVSMKSRTVKIGDLELQILQPLAGESIVSQYMAKHGEGIQHLAFEVADVDMEVEDLVRRGNRLVMRSESPSGRRIAFVDMGDVGGVLVELVQSAPASLTLESDSRGS